jgi:hypothetical protein
MSQLTADDRLAIAEVMASYCHAIDHGRWDELDALFSDDCRLDFGKVMGVFEGRAGLHRFAEMLRSIGIFMRHYTTNLDDELVKVDGRWRIRERRAVIEME